MVFIRLIMQQEIPIQFSAFNVSFNNTTTSNQNFANNKSIYS